MTQNSVSGDAFKAALSQWASGVCIAATRDKQEGLVGITVSSFASLSLQPPLILFCVGRDSRSHDVFLRVKQFTISALTDQQSPIANRFAGPWDERWHDFSYKESHKLPLIPNALFTLTCQRYSIYDGADHSIIVGRVIDSHVSEDKNAKPLTYWQRGYHSLGNILIKNTDGAARKKD